MMPRHVVLFATTVCMFAALQTCATSDHRRPIYVFGHMANSLEEFEGFLAQGVNAIEADVSFAPNGMVTDFYHGPGCDSGRECERRTDAGVYFNHVKRTVSAGGCVTR
ncbi:hypothetical protein MTO96_045075 [Rhipicephalus appendiculatus]